MLLLLVLLWTPLSLSPGGHIRKGLVYGNRMINVRVSNNKLFHRAILIISTIAQVSAEEARTALLRALYPTCSSVEEVEELPISRHVEAALQADRLLPTAILLCKGCATVAAAQQILAHQPRVRLAVQEVLSTSTQPAASTPP